MPGRTRLADLAKTVRSKNAGVDMVTFDIFFDSADNYRRVVDSDVLSRQAVAELYNVAEQDVETHMELAELHAIKFTIRRNRPSGSPGDSDVFGAQQYAPLLEVDVP